MRFQPFLSTAVLLLIIGHCWSCGPQVQNESDPQAADYLLLFEDSTSADQGYRDLSGNTRIFPGEYAMCLTDTFRKYAMVLIMDKGFVVIDRQENIVYEVFNFDNGPDYISEGLFRIIQNGKIGYADGQTYEIAIKPQFDCAYPFENGLAKVSTECTIEEVEEHKTWKSDKWRFVDKNGDFK